MKTISIAVLCLAVSSCATAPSPKCGPCDGSGVPATFAGVAAGDELAARARQVLTALAACDAPPAALQAAGLQLPDEQEAASAHLARRCFTVVRWTQETPTVISFDLAPFRPGRRAGAAEYVMFASYVDSQWRFTWPAALGPPLH